MPVTERRGPVRSRSKAYSARPGPPSPRSPTDRKGIIISEGVVTTDSPEGFLSIVVLDGAGLPPRSRSNLPIVQGRRGIIPTLLLYREIFLFPRRKFGFRDDKVGRMVDDSRGEK